MADVSTPSITKPLEDLTECAMCQEVCTDPRVLPCIHTYCCACLDAWMCRAKHSGDDAFCPLCTAKFTWPKNGAGGLPKNVFVMKLIGMREVAGYEITRGPCDACCAEDSDELQAVPAAVYCVDCRKKLCGQCEKWHHKARASRLHSVVVLGARQKSEELLRLIACEHHLDKNLELFCLNCKAVLCTDCYAHQHSRHKCAKICEVSDNFMKQVKGDIKKISAGLSKLKLNKVKSTLATQFVKAGNEICVKAEEQKELIERHKLKLLDDLESFRESRFQEIVEMERHSVTMEWLKKYADEVIKNGMPCDVVQVASSLHGRRYELPTRDAFKRSLQHLRHDVVTFVPTTNGILVNDARKTIGQTSQCVEETENCRQT